MISSTCEADVPPASAPLTTGVFDLDLRSPAFSRDIGGALREARRSRRIRLRHLADGRLTRRTLKAAERGRLELNRPLLLELSSRYGIDLGALFPPRRRVLVQDGCLVMGTFAEPCDVDSLTSVLQAYLAVIARARGGDASAGPLRRDDIVALADHLDLPCTTVISRLADLLDARGAETRVMMDLYLTGASVIGLHDAPLPPPAMDEVP